MGDILSAEEVGALLSAAENDPIYQLLAQRGVSVERIASFYHHVKGLDPGLSEEEMRDSALHLAHQLLGMEASDGEWAHVKSEVRRLIGAKRHQDETDARVNEKAERGEARIVTSYDFKHPARLLSSTFSGAMRAVVDVDTAFVDQTTYAELIHSLSNPACSYQFTFGTPEEARTPGTHGGQAILDIAMPLVFAFVDRIFGGKGSSEGVQARTMSQIEMGVIAKILKRMVEDLEHTWAPIQRVEVSDIELETNPEFMQIAAPSDIVILLAFEVNSTNASGLVSLAYPFYTLEPLLPRLGQQAYVRHHRRDEAETIRKSRAALGPTPIELAVELGKTAMSLADVDGLQVDDVIWCPTQVTEPLVMHAGDQPKFYVRPFATESGRLAVKGVGKVPRELQASIKDA
jgi:flagellar motor switch protein FliM